MLAGPVRVFDLKSCRDLLGKLERELVRLEYSHDRFDRGDHAANFAIWAWRLSDWVYAEVAARPPLRRRIAEDALSLEDFQRYLLGPEGCRGLVCCRAIALAAKPVEGDERPLQAAAKVVMLRPAAGGGRSVELTEWRDSRWLVMSGETGQAVPEVELFQDVLHFWGEFIHAHHIA